MHFIVREPYLNLKVKASNTSYCNQKLRIRIIKSEYVRKKNEPFQDLA